MDVLQKGEKWSHVTLEFFKRKNRLDLKIYAGAEMKYIAFLSDW